MLRKDLSRVNDLSFLSRSRTFLRENYAKLREKSQGHARIFAKSLDRERGWSGFSPREANPRALLPAPIRSHQALITSLHYSLPLITTKPRDRLKFSAIWSRFYTRAGPAAKHTFKALITTRNSKILCRNKSVFLTDKFNVLNSWMNFVRLGKSFWYAWLKKYSKQKHERSVHFAFLLNLNLFELWKFVIWKGFYLSLLQTWSWGWKLEPSLPSSVLL